MQAISLCCIPMLTISLSEELLQTGISENADNWLNQPEQGKEAEALAIQQEEQLLVQAPAQPVEQLAEPLLVLPDVALWLVLPAALPGDYCQVCLVLVRRSQLQPI